MGGCITGLGIPPTQIGNVYGVMKAYSTRGKFCINFSWVIK